MGKLRHGAGGCSRDEVKGHDRGCSAAQCRGCRGWRPLHPPPSRPPSASPAPPPAASVSLQPRWGGARSPSSLLRHRREWVPVCHPSPRRAPLPANPLLLLLLLLAAFAARTIAGIYGAGGSGYPTSARWSPRSPGGGGDGDTGPLAWGYRRPRLRHDHPAPRIPPGVGGFSGG